MSTCGLPAHPTSRIDYPRVSLLSLGHLMNDLYGNVMTSLTPYLILQGRISATVAGLVLLVYLIGSSVLQPIFGLVSDRSGRRMFAIAGPLWIGVAASCFGWASNAGELLALAGLGGIGTAAFHPQAASMVDRLSPRNKGWSMAIFSTGGNVGFALGPALAALIAVAGLHWSIVIFIPGIALSLLLALFTPDVRSSERALDVRALRHTLSRSWRRLSLIVAVIAIRSGAQYALIILLPLYYYARGFPAQLGSYYAVVLSLSGALGGLAGGRLSDRYGRRRVVVTSLLVTAPVMYISLLLTGLIVWPLLAVCGATLLASNSVTVVQGQEVLPENTGLASGITLGLAFGLSGVITSSVGVAVDHIGASRVIFSVPFLPLLAAGLAALTGPAAAHAPRRPVRPTEVAGTAGPGE